MTWLAARKAAKRDHSPPNETPSAQIPLLIPQRNLLQPLLLLFRLAQLPRRRRQSQHLPFGKLERLRIRDGEGFLEFKLGALEPLRFARLGVFESGDEGFGFSREFRLAFKLRAGARRVSRTRSAAGETGSANSQSRAA